MAIPVRYVFVVLFLLVSIFSEASVERPGLHHFRQCCSSQPVSTMTPFQYRSRFIQIQVILPLRSPISRHTRLVLVLVLP